MDTIEKLARNVVATGFDDIPSDAIGMVKMEVLDTLGTLIAGHNAPGCASLVNLVKEWGGKPEGTVLCYGGKVPAYNAVLVNSAMARALDYDCTVPGGVHCGASSVPTALAAAEMCGGKSGREFLAAIVLGEDVAGRLHLACRYRGFKPMGICMGFGTAGVTGKLMGLNENEMRNALGIAFAQAAGSIQSDIDGALSVRLSQGLTSRAGLQSAIFARHGFTGAINVVDGKYGFLNLFSDKEPRVDALTRDLGTRFSAPDHISFKPYPSCMMTNSPTWLTLQLVEKHDIKPEQVARIRVGVTPHAYDMVGKAFSIGERPQVDAQFSLQYTVANALVRRSSQLQHFTEKLIRDPDVLSLVPRVHPEIDHSVEKEDGDWGAAAVDITLNSGKTYSLATDYPKGRPQTPLTQDEIRRKFLDCVAFSGNLLPAGRADEILDFVDRLENIPDVTLLAGLLVP